MKDHKFRVEAFRKLRALRSVFAGSRLKADDLSKFMPDWQLVGPSGEVIASLSSRHVVHGIYNHFLEGFEV